ncbi:MAG TPA: DUF1259 domain-containing protein [Gemmatimonadaceae bacterium]|nr:DUF1259 domain-containing protein [Gemmatimonadaceae bacterium]
MRRMIRGVSVAAVACLAASIEARAQDSSGWSAADRALGRAGAAQPGGVHKYSFPRGDLSVTVNGIQLRPALALGSWIAFKRTGDGKTMAMGDLVLTESEVAPVMAKLQQGGVEQTAVHNHLLGETPRIVYMHVMATGDEAKIAQTIHDALAASHTPMAPPPKVTALRLTLDTVAFANALGVTGKGNGGVYQISVPRPEAIHEGSEVIPPSMGVATGINVQPTTNGRAVTTGDFVLLPAEVNPVIRALESNGIKVTALHSHLLTDQPHVMFMHFWGDDDALKLARGLRAALDATAMAPAKPR